MRDLQQRKPILVIVGNQSYVQGIYSSLSEMHFSGIVYTAGRGTDAYDLIMEKEPDIVIMDLALSMIDGLELLEMLRSLAISHCRILVCSYVSGEQTAKLAVRAGADYFLRKPYEERTFQALMEELLQRETPSSYTYAQQLQLRVLSLMNQAGLSPGTKGYQYAVYGLQQVYQKPQLLQHMMGELYPGIAAAFETQPRCVERNIRHAIERAWESSNLTQLEQLFGYTVDSDRGRPSVSSFLATMAAHLRNQLNRVE